MSLKLYYRHSGYSPEHPDLVAVYDDVYVINERATTTISLVQNELLSDRTLDDKFLFVALETVRLELQDIDALLGHFVDSQQKAGIKKTP